MACERTLQENQTPVQRKQQVREAVAKLDLALRMRSIKAVIDPKTRAIAFQGWNAGRDGVSDACAYRMLMTSGSAMAKQMLSALNVNPGATVHSHDGGATWDPNH